MIRMSNPPDPAPTSVADESQTNLSEAGRMIAFSDGVVAIAITLMILPLADIDLPNSSKEATDNPLAYIWDQNSSLIVSFLISWAVIIVFWVGHHRMFDRVSLITPGIMRLNILWLFAVVVLPFPTNLMQQVTQSQTGAVRQITLFYVGTMLLMSVTQGLMSREIRTHPELLDPAAPAQGWGTSPAWAISVVLGCVLVAAIFIPKYAIWGLFGMALIGPYYDLRERQAKKAAAATTDTR